MQLKVTIALQRYAVKDWGNLDDEDKKTNEEAYIEELMEKPISQWNKEEVKTYASLKNIDISNTKNIGEARNIIKQSIDK